MFAKIMRRLRVGLLGWGRSLICFFLRTTHSHTCSSRSYECSSETLRRAISPLHLYAKHYVRYAPSDSSVAGDNCCYSAIVQCTLRTSDAGSRATWRIGSFGTYTGFAETASSFTHALRWRGDVDRKYKECGESALSRCTIRGCCAVSSCEGFCRAS